MEMEELVERMYLEIDRHDTEMRLLVSEYLESEEPPDPAAVEGERRSRDADPWGVMAVELGLVLKGVEAEIAQGMARLRLARESGKI